MKCPKCRTDNPSDSKYCKECATSLHASEEIPVSRTMTIQAPPKVLAKGITLAGKYRIVEPVGKGGMGVVYKAEDIKLERTVALKFLPPGLTQDPEAKELNVKAIVEASVLKSGNKVRLIARLIDPRRNAQIWEDTFEREYSD